MTLWPSVDQKLSMNEAKSCYISKWPSNCVEKRLFSVQYCITRSFSKSDRRDVRHGHDQKALIAVPAILSELSLQFLGCRGNRPRNNSKFDFTSSKKNRSGHKSLKRQYPVSNNLIYQI